MDNLITSVSAVATMAVPLLVGILLRSLHVLKDDFNKTVSDLIYTVCLPVSLACTMYSNELNFSFLSLAISGYTIGMLILGFLFFRRIAMATISSPAKAGSFLQGCIRGNATIYGLPLAVSLYGSDQLGDIPVLLCISIISFNILSILSFMTCSEERNRKTSIFRSILKNPSIIGIVIGLLFNLSGITIPSMLYKPINAIGGITTSLCFIGIGSSLSFESIRENGKLAMIVSLVRLVFFPVITITLAILLGFRNQQLVGLLAIFATPCAVGSYPMALKLGGDGPLSAQAITFSTVASILTIFLFIFTLRNFSFI